MTVPGAVVAAVLLVALGLVIYGTARSHPWLKSGVGVPLAIGVYAALGGAVFAASYGYRNGDKRAALKLTAMIMTVATLVVGAVVAVFLLLDSDSGKSQKESRHDRDRTPPDRPSSHSTASFVDDTFDEAVGANYLLGGGHGPAAGSWAAGWYADPWHTARLRYWDGTEWTGRTG
jgi:hypothetical protein